LRAGDVITAVAGRPARNVEGAMAGIHLHRPGDTLEIALIRDGMPGTLALTLAR
jgi:S1-C subfamily serine protease